MLDLNAFTETRSALLARGAQIESAWALLLKTTTAVDRPAPSLEEDPVRSQVAMAKVRLEQTMLEIGIFGQINRGKSTLLNALVGGEFSAMASTPETAVPTWLERGTPEGGILQLADGSVREVSRADAVTMSGRKHDETDPSTRVVRVIQRVESDLIPEGFRLVDTPGLSDPTTAEAYTELTLAELDRVAAAVLVVMYLPGLDAFEVKFLEELRQREVSEVFLVMNFTTDLWEEGDELDVLEAHLRSIVGNSPSLRVFRINARKAWRAIQQSDDAGFDKSGVQALKSAIEDHLHSGALASLERVANEHLGLAFAYVESRLRSRQQVLADPTRLEAVASAARDRTHRERSKAKEILDRIAESGQALAASVALLVSKDLGNLESKIADATTKAELEAIDTVTPVVTEGLRSKVEHTLDQGAGRMEHLAAEALRSAYGVDADLPRPTKADFSIGALEVARIAALSEPDADLVRIGGVAAGVLGGGALAGGAGIALLALGPVGWAIGAVVGGAAALFGAQTYLSRISPAQKKQTLATFRDHRQEVEAKLHTLAIGLATDVSRHVERTLTDVLADGEREAAALQELVGRPELARRALEDCARVESMLAEAR